MRVCTFDTPDPHHAVLWAVKVPPSTHMAEKEALDIRSAAFVTDGAGGMLSQVRDM